MTDEKGNFWTLESLLKDLGSGDSLYLTPKMCSDLAALLRLERDRRANAEFDRDAYKHRPGGLEYICKCGVRVVPHQCKTDGGF